MCHFTEKLFNPAKPKMHMVDMCCVASGANLLLPLSINKTLYSADAVRQGLKLMIISRLLLHITTK